VTTAKERSFFKLLMVIAYVSTLSFSLYFYYHEVYILAYNGFLCLVLFIIFGIASLFISNLLWLFRLSVLTAFHAFYFEVLFTGGAMSPALMELIIPPAFAFFYKPTRDRYLFLGLAMILALSIWPLSTYGFTENRFPPECNIEFHSISVLFVFGTFGLYLYMYHRSLLQKNRALRRSYQELQNTSEKLIESEKMASLGVLSAGVAHEINNPLNFIKGGAEMLSIELEKSNEVRPYIDAIHEGVLRATSIVNSLTHFSRNTESMNEICDIHEIMENCLTMLNHQLKYKVEVIKNYGDLGSTRILGNEGRIHQALLNIISNAEQAIPGQGTITITTSLDDETLKLTISDNGKGIAPDQLAKIRDPFYTTKSPGEGTGLGLSITYKVIEEHQGSIEVQSEIDRGTEFSITFNNLIQFEND